MPTPPTREVTWRKAAELVADVATASSIHEMVAIAIERAHALFEADIVICDRFDEQARQIAFQMYPAPTTKFVELTLQPFLAFWHQHPFQPEWVCEIPKGRIALLSDRITHRQFSQTDLWNEAYIHLRGKNQIMLGGEIETNRYFCLSCNRLGRDYSTHERELGRFVQSRLTRLIQFQARRDHASQTLHILQQTSAAFLVIDAQAQLLELSDAALHMLSVSGKPALDHPLLAELSQQLTNQVRPGSMTTHRIEDLNACMLRPSAAGAAFVILGSGPGPVITAESKLTARESEIFHWIGQGKSNGEIAILLGISARTVEKHCENLFGKVGVENRLSAGLLARDVR
jgi:DNA-binding CsgD family transcriptional regulator